MQAQAAGKLAHLYNSASGIYDLINVCSTDDDDNEGESIQPPMRVVCDMDTEGGGVDCDHEEKKNNSFTCEFSSYMGSL